MVDLTHYEGTIWMVTLIEGSKHTNYVCVAPHKMGAHQATLMAAEEHLDNLKGGVKGAYLLEASPLLSNTIDEENEEWTEASEP